MARERVSYVCGECEASFPRWSGRCPNCQEWDTLQEVRERPQGKGSFGKPAARAGVAATPLAQVEARRLSRLGSDIPELDRVLGGGVLPGSSILLGGEPGIGKSTILLQALGRMAARGVPCLYVSCEESLGQLKLRAERLGLKDSALPVAAQSDLASILGLIAAGELRVLVVDSIQRVHAAELDSATGSLRQVSTCATGLTETCKERAIALFLVGHVTKRGLIAGPRALEHLVDTVLYFEGETAGGAALRVLRAVKNRFGPVNEIGVFEMHSEGLREVSNPSALFLAERDADAAGSVVTATMEGSRALLVEVQALVGPGAYGTPERKASGIDYRRFSMMLSVLERQAGLELGRCDAFVNVAGGVRVYEPAADLPLLLALASSFREAPFFADGVAVGEVGLGGEVRAVGRIEDRLREARKLGFERAVVPVGNAPAARRLMAEVHAVRRLTDALRLLGTQGQ